jgi:DNA-binding CsgD family transcriptional regulator
MSQARTWREGYVDGETAIIRDIYAAALDERPWQDIVAKTAKLLDATGGFLFTTMVPESDGGLAASHGFPEHQAKRFLTEVATVDVWYHELLRRHGRLRTGLVWQTEELMSQRELHRTQFFSDYLVPCDIGRNLGAIVGDGSSEWLPLTPLCFYRPIRSEPFSAGEEAKLGTLLPHFTQAMAMRQRLQGAAQGAATLAIERVSTAVVVLARDRKILLANPAADVIFSESGLPLVRDGRLCACDPGQLAALERLLEACSNYRFDEHFSQPLRLGGEPGSGVVARLVPPPMSTPKASKAAAIAFLMREGHSALDLQAMVRALYKLSPMEAALVKALSEGLTLEAFAEARHVGLATMKTQLRSVFAKTGTRRQSELMRLVYSIAR